MSVRYENLFWFRPNYLLDFFYHNPFWLHLAPLQSLLSVYNTSEGHDIRPVVIKVEKASIFFYCLRTYFFCFQIFCYFLFNISLLAKVSVRKSQKMLVTAFTI